jgi:hypothetical protein
MRCQWRAGIGQSKSGSEKLIKGHHRTGVGNLGMMGARPGGGHFKWLARANSVGLVAVSRRARLQD